MPKTNRNTTHAGKKPKAFYSEGQAPRGPETPTPHSALPTPHSYHPLAPSHFTLREDGSVEPHPQIAQRHADSENKSAEISEISGQPPRLVFSSESPFVRLYHGNCLELLDAIYDRYREDGRFDMIFADPPYFLSNGGITCHAGKMVKVDKGDWDKSRGPELNHEFNKEWLLRCQRVLKPNGTIWVSGTHHVIFSIGYAMQELGFKILNDIAWEKPNPPPNLSCRYFTHSTETILWAAKNEKSKHTFNYQEMRKVTGKQMKTVWRREELPPQINADERRLDESESKKENLRQSEQSADKEISSIWTMSAPGNDEKQFGKHPTQKPVALIERCLLASTNAGDFVLDPFLGAGTTAIACIRLNRQFIGIELDLAHVTLAERRVDREIVEIWLRNFQVRVTVSVAVTAGQSPARRPLHNPERRARSDAPYLETQIDLDLFADSINGSRAMDDKPQVPTERIFHETKFVFLSCAEVERGSVVHTTVDVSLQEAWAKTPTGKKRETTHIVRCETEILRIKG